MANLRYYVLVVFYKSDTGNKLADKVLPDTIL